MKRTSIFRAIKDAVTGKKPENKPEPVEVPKAEYRPKDYTPEPASGGGLHFPRNRNHADVLKERNRLRNRIQRKSRQINRRAA